MKNENAGFVPVVGNVFARTDAPEKSPVRVVYADDSRIYTITTDRTKDKEVPKAESLQAFLEALEDGRIVEAEDDYELEYLTVELTEEELERLEREWELFSGFWNDPRKKGAFLCRNLRRGVVAEFAQTLGISASTALRKIVRFLQGGCSRLSLLALNRFGGRKEQEDGKRRGRKSGKSDYVLTGEDKKNIELAYKRIVLGEGKSFREAFCYFLGENYCYKSEDEDGNVEFVLENRRHVPTFDQFLYHLGKVRDHRAELETKLGTRKVENSHSVDMGSHRDGFAIRGPGSCYEIDATYLQINLLSDLDEKKIISHPLLYTAIDVYSGLITAQVLTMEKESRESSKLLYLNMMEDKVEYSAVRGVSITPDQWPAHHLPASVLADNGKAKFSNADVIARDLDIRMLHTRSYTPKDKPYIERAHRIYKDFLSRFLKSVDKKGGKERGEKDPKKYASLTMEELEKILIELTVRHNTSPQPKYPATPRMMSDEIETTPAEIWKWGIRKGLSELRTVGEETKKYLEIHLLPLADKKTRVLREDDLQVNGFRYKPGSIGDRMIYERHLGESVPVMYDPDDVGYVFIDLEGKTLRLVLSDEYEAFSGFPLEDTRRLRKNMRRANEGNYHTHLEESINDVMKYRDEIRKKEEERTKDLTPESAKAIKENNKEARRKEKERRKAAGKKASDGSGKAPARKKKENFDPDSWDF